MHPQSTGCGKGTRIQASMLRPLLAGTSLIGAGGLGPVSLTLASLHSRPLWGTSGEHFLPLSDGRLQRLPIVVQRLPIVVLKISLRSRPRTQPGSRRKRRSRRARPGSGGTRERTESVQHRLRITICQRCDPGVRQMTSDEVGGESNASKTMDTCGRCAQLVGRRICHRGNFGVRGEAAVHVTQSAGQSVRQLKRSWSAKVRSRQSTREFASVLS